MEKTLLNIMSDEDISCIESMLSTEEGLKMLQQSNTLILPSQIEEERIVSETNDSFLYMQHPSKFVNPALLNLEEFLKTPASHVNTTTLLEASNIRGSQLTDTHSVFPDALCVDNAAVTDVLINDVLEVLENRQQCERLFDDDDDDITQTDSNATLLKNTNHSFDDFSFLNLSIPTSVGRLLEDSVFKDDDLLIDESYLQVCNKTKFFTFVQHMVQHF